MNPSPHDPPPAPDPAEAQAIYQRLTASLPGIVYRVHIKEQNRMQFLNGQVWDITGYRAEELCGGGTCCGLDPLIVAEDRDQVIREVRRAVASNSPFAVGYRLRHKDGDIRHLLERGIPVNDRDGNPQYIDGVIFDITSQKITEQRIRGELTERVRELDTVQRVARLGSYVLDIQSGIFSASAMTDEIFGVGPDYAHTVEGWSRRIVPEQQQEMRSYLERILKERQRFEKEYRIVRLNDQTIRWLSGTGEVEYDADGPVRMVGTVQDITERKQAEIALQRSENMLQAIIDTEPECVKLLDAEARVIMMNRAGLTMIEVDGLEQIKGQCVCPMVAGEYWDAFMDLTRRVFRGESGTLVFEMIGAKGRHLWLETHAVPFRNERDEIIALLGVTRDITAQRQAEEALIKSRERYQTLYNEAPILMHSIDRSGRLIDVNNHWLRTMGYERDEVLGRKVTDFYSEESRQYAEEVVQPAFFRAGSCTDIALQFVKKNGERIDVLLSATGERDADGTVISSRAVIQDVTDRHRLEAEQLKAQKMEAIGTLAGGIAHDFNNLLQGIFGYLSLAKLDIDHKDDALKAMAQAEKALALAKQLAMQLLTFAKGGKPVKRPILLAGVIEDSVRFALSGSRCDSRIRIQGDLWPVAADEGQIGQVIQNIVLNADQAMTEGGQIEITATNISLPDPSRPLLDLPAGNYVAVAVRDHGPGIPAPHLTKIFDPYFTTKARGSGLGLATSYSIVKNHEGLLSVDSDPGRGSCFTLYLPALEPAPAPGRPEQAAAEAESKRGRILVMDDDEIIRDIAGQMLQAIGHEVDFAEHGEEAVAKYRQAMEGGQPFDAVILDLTIRGGMGGYDTMRQLLALDPQVKAVVSSGYSNDTILAGYRGHGFRACLSKPYALKELRDTMQGLLAEGS